MSNFYEIEGICELDMIGFDELFGFAHLLELTAKQKHRNQMRFYCRVEIIFHMIKDK
jgi:hypothetical protein